MLICIEIKLLIYTYSYYKIETQFSKYRKDIER